MATVYKRGEIWWAQWINPQGKRVARTTGLTKRREAEKAAEDMESRDRRAAKDAQALPRAYVEILNRATADAHKGLLDPDRFEEHLMAAMRIANPEYRRVTVRECFEGWLESVSAGVKGRTAQNYREAGKSILAALGKASDAPLAELNKQQVEKALKAMVKPGVKGKTRRTKAVTANLHLAAFRRAMQWGIDNKWIRDNPAARVKPLPESDSAERAPFTLAEVRRMISLHESEEWDGVLIIGSNTGLRLGDIISLKDAHRDGSRLVIRPSKTDKTKKTLSIPLTPPCLKWLDGRSGKAWFPVLKKTSIPERSMQFKRIMAKAGVPDRVLLPGGIEKVRSAHSLRHSFISWLAEADIHADVRQKLAGHSSDDIHEIYTHHDEALDRAIQTLPDVMSA